MGQEQSSDHVPVAPSRHYRKYHDRQRSSSIDFHPYDHEHNDYTQKSRRSIDSFKSDNSSTESSGYRSGSSAYDRSDRSSKSDYYCIPLYKNDHYKDVNKELYRPVKIPKDKRYKLQLFDADNIKSARIKSYLSDTEKAKLKAGPVPKKAGIRNYTPKIISAEEERKKIESWM